LLYRSWCRSIDVDTDTLQPWQLTNHFLKNVAITTKIGLLKSLQSVTWLADVSVNEIIPRGYDLSNPMEMQAFIDDFRVQKASSVLKRLYFVWTGKILPVPLGDRPASSSTSSAEERFPSAGMPPVFAEDESSLKPINVAVFEACCIVLERQLKPYNDDYIDEQDANATACSIHNRSSSKGAGSSVAGVPTGINSTVDVTGTEWELINNFDVSKPGVLPAEPQELIDAFLQSNEEVNANTSGHPTGYTGIKSVALQHRERKRRQQLDKQERDWATDNVSVMRKPTKSDLQRVHNILYELQRAESYQSYLNGSGVNSNNIWIVKPAAKSRGRGITTFSDLSKLLKYVDAGTG
jgi:tubulin monoglycylase TTLL3/8